MNTERASCPSFMLIALNRTQTRTNVPSFQGTQGEADGSAGLKVSGRHSQCLTPSLMFTPKCHFPDAFPKTMPQLSNAGLLETF